MAAPIRVLAVAEESDVDGLTESIDSDGRFEVDTASTVRDAIGRLADDCFDCLVSAYRLPE